MRKCLDDSDDEVRERAYFYIVLIEQSLPAEQSVLDEELSVTAESDNELEELREFVFDPSQNIDVDALEKYLTENAEALKESDELISIDVSKMVRKNAPTT